MAQQTAVEWFASEVLDYTTLIPMRIIKKAKEMQKQQTIEFAEQYNDYLEKCKRGIRASVVEMDAEQYYNETFNK